jgi:hypothetical protein
MGSSSDDAGNALAVDGSGNAYVAGKSDASWGTPANAHAGGWDVFAAKLNGSGVLQWHTFMGSSSIDYGHALAVGAGNVYVGGRSDAAWGTPVNAHAGGWDAFAAKLNGSGVLQWNTFMGSSSSDYGFALAVGGSNVYVSGFSEAAWGSPVNGHAGGQDAFVARLDDSPTLVELASFTAEAQGRAVTVAWETAVEVNSAGFNLYRARAKDGTRTQLNAHLIASQAPFGGGASYHFQDTPGAGTFTYWLEDVDYNGARTLHGPVQVRTERPGTIQPPPVPPGLLEPKPDPAPEQ